MTVQTRRPADLDRALRRVADLVSAGLVPHERRVALEQVAARYAVAITPHLVDLIDPADPSDPLARQFLPDERELIRHAADRPDPIGDITHEKLPGLVHRYPDRVLLKPIHACPVYCRFCFRRERVGPGGDVMTDADLAAAIDYIAARPAIFEAIVTGGDPLMLAPRRIASLVAALSRIPHLGVIRFHTRVPIVDPARIGPALLESLETDKGLFVAIHANHPTEFSEPAMAAIRRLNRAGAALLGQTVLLAGINDDADILGELFRRMVSLRIKPYYLHHPDLAPGTAHFRTSLARGRDLVARLRGPVSGLCQPTYVLDLPGGHGKVPAAAAGIEPVPAGWRATDWRGEAHEYPDVLE